MKSYLMLTTGPVPISERVRSALSQPMLYHRDNDFVEIFNRVVENMQYFLQTGNDVILLTSSGTGGMEAAISNLFSPGEEVIIVENGKFSERWSQIAKVFQLKVHSIPVPWGQSVNLTRLKQAIHEVPNVKGIFLTHCESSTGALTNVELLVPEIRKLSSALVIVDAISTAGVVPLKMDSWQIDVLVTASQKGLGIPPGLAFVALNNRAWQRSEQADLPRFYFDFSKARQAISLSRGAAYTPAIPIIYAADAALSDIKQTSLETIWEERRVFAQSVRERISGMGLPIFPDEPADGLTVVKTAPSFSANKIIEKLKQEYRIIVSRGQGQLQDQVLRIGHLVKIEQRELNQFYKALETILTEYE